MMKKQFLAGAALSASLLSPFNAQAQLFDVSPFVPTEVILPIIALGVEDGLPVLGNLLTGTPLSGPLFDNFGAAKPITDLVLGGDTIKELTVLYEPLDMALEPLVVIVADGGIPL